MSIHSPYDEAHEAPGGGLYLSPSQLQAVLIVVLLVAVYLFLRSVTMPDEPLFPGQAARVVIATPTLGILPTLMPTQPPQVIYIERPAEPAPAPVVIDDHSVNVCIGLCPNGSR